MRFASSYGKTGLVCTVSLNLVPKERFSCKMRFVSFCVKIVKCKTFYYKTPKLGLIVQDTVTVILVNLR